MENLLQYLKDLYAPTNQDLIEILPLLSHQDQDVLLAAFKIICTHGKAILTHVLENTKSEKPLIRANSILAAGYCGRQSDVTPHRARELLTDSDPMVRAKAARALSLVGESMDVKLLKKSFPGELQDKEKEEIKSAYRKLNSDYAGLGIILQLMNSSDPSIISKLVTRWEELEDWFIHDLVILATEDNPTDLYIAWPVEVELRKIFSCANTHQYRFKIARFLARLSRMNQVCKLLQDFDSSLLPQDIFHLYASALLKENLHQDAINLLSYALDHHPANFGFHELMVQALLETRGTVGVLGYYEGRYGIADGDNVFKFVLALLDMKAGALVEAVQQLQEISEKQEHPSVQLALGQCFLKLASYSEAHRHAAMVLVEFPDNYRALELRCDALEAEANDLYQRSTNDPTYGSLAESAFNEALFVVNRFWKLFPMDSNVIEKRCLVAKKMINHMYGLKNQRDDNLMDISEVAFEFADGLLEAEEDLKGKISKSPNDSAQTEDFRRSGDSKENRGIGILFSWTGGWALLVATLLALLGKGFWLSFFIAWALFILNNQLIMRISARISYTQDAVRFYKEELEPKEKAGCFALAFALIYGFLAYLTVESTLFIRFFWFLGIYSLIFSVFLLGLFLFFHDRKSQCKRREFITAGWASFCFAMDSGDLVLNWLKENPDQLNYGFFQEFLPGIELGLKDSIDWLVFYRKAKFVEYLIEQLPSEVLLVAHTSLVELYRKWGEHQRALNIGLLLFNKLQNPQHGYVDFALALLKIYCLQGNWDEAQTLQDKVASACRYIGAPLQEIEAGLILSEELLEAGFIQQASDIAPSIQQVDAIDAKRCVKIALFRLEKLRIMEKYGAREVDSMNNLKQVELQIDDLKARVRLLRAEILVKQGKPGEADALLKRRVFFSLKGDSYVRRAKICALRASLMVNLYRFKYARGYYQRALRFKLNKRPELMLRILLNYVDFLQMGKCYEEAATQLEAGKKMLQLLGRGVMLAEVAVREAEHVFFQQKFILSRDLARSALLTFQEHNREKGVARSMVIWGKTEIEAGDLDQGIALLEEAVEKYDNISAFWEKARAMHDLGCGYLAAGLKGEKNKAFLDKACSCFQSAVKLGEESGLPLHETAAFHGPWGNAFERLKKLENEPMEQWMDEYFDHIVSETFASALHYAVMQQKDLDKSISKDLKKKYKDEDKGAIELEKDLDTAIRDGRVRDELHILHRIATYWQQQVKAQSGDTGLIDTANRAFDRLLSRIEEIRKNMVFEDSKIAYLRNKEEMYDEALQLAWEQGQVKRMWDLLERNKSAVLSEGLALSSAIGPAPDTPATAGLKGKAAEEFKQLRQTEIRLSEELKRILRRWESAPIDNRREIEIHLQRAKTELNEILLKMKKFNPGYVSLRLGEIPSYEDIMTQMTKIIHLRGNEKK